MTDSIQNELPPVRPPQVHITYDVETGGAIEKRELPFIIGILADLSGDRIGPDSLPPLADRKMIEIDRNNFNDVMKAIAPRVDLSPVLNALPELRNGSDTADKSMVFRSLQDFEPPHILNALPALRAMTATPAAQAGSRLGEALAAIMQSPSFKAVESTWRSLFHLVSRADTGAMLTLRVLDAAKTELLADLGSAGDIDHSALFKHLYESAYGSFGGQPYSLLVGGYEFNRNNGDISILKCMASIAAAAHAPFIAAASSELFGLSGFDKLNKPRTLAKIFESVELEDWREVRDMEDARYLVLVVPRMLVRLPYGSASSAGSGESNAIRYEGIDVDEQAGGEDNSRFLWGNAAFALAERIANAFSLFRWPATFSGEPGGLVEGLPVYQYQCTPDAGGMATVGPAEISIAPGRERELHELGFITLCNREGKAVFSTSHTVSQPKRYFSEDANANAQISAMLPYVLAASRFAHYVKVIMRDKVGSFMTRGNVESYLNTWISNYVLLDDNAPQEMKAAIPLRAANIVVTEVAGSPGTYRATMFIQPHFQLEELTTSIRLAVDLPA